METRWLYVTSEEFSKLREASKDVCIIPIKALKFVKEDEDLLKWHNQNWKATIESNKTISE